MMECVENSAPNTDVLSVSQQSSLQVKAPQRQQRSELRCVPVLRAVPDRVDCVLHILVRVVVLAAGTRGEVLGQRKSHPDRALDP